MEDIINAINYWMQTLPKVYDSMAETEISNRPLPNNWSKKEILGHLCDSALNNINRFIKIQYEEQPFVIQSYNQDQWVILQNYQERPLEEIVNLFLSLNEQIINIISNIPKERLSYLCDIGNKQETLEWLVKDYLNHMEHHINNQILNKNKE